MPSAPVPIPSRYQHTGVVLSGGQGDVYVCRDTALARDVAIKFVRNAGDPASLESEVQALSAIQSKHVVELYDLLRGTNNSSLGLVLEYLPGPDLTNYAPTDSHEFLFTLYQLASGLTDIHQSGKIHRDVKPKNMKRDGNGIVKLFDFGLSCNTDDAETTALRGSRYYRGPEYYLPPPVILDQAVDTYAFAVSIWHWATQSLPWQLRNAPPTQPASLGSVTTLLPPDVAILIDAAVDPNPESRPTMAVIRDAVAAHLLHNQHRAHVSNGTSTFALNASNPTVRFRAGNTASAQITYDGLVFRLTQVVGDVYVNGDTAAADYLLPESCVITLGAPELGWERTFVTVDVSHPEVIL